MPSQPNPIADQLLGRLPNPSELTQYREHVTQALKEERRRLHLKRIATYAFWIFCAATATAWLWFSAESAHLPRAPFLAVIFLICGGVEVIKHAVVRGRFEVLKEIKQLQLQVFDLQQKLEAGS